eukprot:CAMPEP_0172442544 /NCGR_PEP_ID=MMETSP1065-20121228/2949_1 /TAXON_ID=265537 /ORGANISM="Amphiprora paludosa, Strain CCMP125" /LENGTH=72 /DNA_ID=CAMNT_0013192433 /DNA_START=109 /DNA_END=327 /DNA_ORIENTATION=-
MTAMANIKLLYSSSPAKARETQAKSCVTLSSVNSVLKVTLLLLLAASGNAWVVRSVAKVDAPLLAVLSCPAE